MGGMMALVIIKATPERVTQLSLVDKNARQDTFGAPMSRGDSGMDLADLLLPSQPCYSGNEEIAAICADYLVERRGFEQMPSRALGDRDLLKAMARRPAGQK
jgi:hypothetical protein